MKNQAPTLKCPPNIQPKTLIPLKRYTVSIGYSLSEVAIINPNDGEFYNIKGIRKGGVLARIKEKFKIHLNNDVHFCFSHMSKADTIELIRMLE